MTVWRFADGKIAEEWVFLNDLDLYRQVGFSDLSSPFIGLGLDGTAFSIRAGRVRKLASLGYLRRDLD